MLIYRRSLCSLTLGLLAGLTGLVGLVGLVSLSASAAAAEMRPVAIDLYPHGDPGQGHPIRLVLEAEFTPGGKPLEGLAEAPPAGSVERLVADYVAVLRAETVEEALPFWHVDERQQARQRLTPVFDKQRALLTDVEQTRLYTKLRYGRYLLAAVRHVRPDKDPLVVIYPMVEVDGGWAFSNALGADPMFQLLYVTFHDGLGLDRPFETVD